MSIVLSLLEFGGVGNQQKGVVLEIDKPQEKEEGVKTCPWFECDFSSTFFEMLLGNTFVWGHLGVAMTTTTTTKQERHPNHT